MKPGRCTKIARFSGRHSQRIRKHQSHDHLPLAGFAALIAVWLAGSAICRNATAQVGGGGPAVFVDDSPQAQESLGRISDQIASGNLPEAARISMQLLNELPTRLVAAPSGKTDGLFVSVRAAVQRRLTEQPALFQAYLQMADPAAANLLKEGRYDEVYRSAFLTRAGLSAGFELVEQAIRSGRLKAAESLLTELRSHPDLQDTSEDGAAQRWAILAAHLGILAHDPLLSQQANAMLPADQRQAIESGAADEALPMVRSHHDLRDRLIDPTLKQMGGSPSWRAHIRPAPLERRSDSATPLQIAQMIRILPVLTDDFVFLDDGSSIEAIDRFDGRMRWKHDYSTSPAADAETDRFFDPRPLLVENDASIPVIADHHIIAIIDRSMNHPVSETMLVCHDTESGAPLWTITPQALSDELGDGIFVGLPVAFEGKVLVLVRKDSQRLVSEFLTAIDAETGRLIWSQHIASTGITYQSRGVSVPSTCVMIHGDTAYLSSPMGAICAIEARSGLIKWLRIQSPYQSPRLERIAAWAFDQIQWTPMGLVAFTPNRTGMALMDPETGEDKSFAASSTWHTPDYFVAGADAIYAAGTEVVRIDPHNMTKPTLFMPPDMQPDEFLCGRIAVTPGEGNSRDTDLVLVSTNRRLVLMRGLDGSVVEQYQVSEMGVPLVVGGEVLLASIDGIESFLPYELGEPRLIARLKANPFDPNPAISLARLAFQHGKVDRLLEPIDQALDLIRREPLNQMNVAASQRLFESLLDMASSTTLPDDLVEALFSRANMIASTSDQRLAYYMTLAGSLTRRNRTGEAVDAWQTILQTDTLADAFCTLSQRRVRAWIEAREQLSRLIAGHGSEVYNLYEQKAAAEFDRIRQSADSDALLAITRRYPMSQAGARACAAAAFQLQASGATGRAAAALRLGLEGAPANSATDELEGDLLELLDRAGNYASARQLLYAIEDRNPEALIPSGPAGADPITISKWRERITHDAGPTRHLAHIGRITGRMDIREGEWLLIPDSGAPSATLAVVRDARSLVGYRPDNAPAFLQMLDTTTKDLVRIDGNKLLMCAGGSRGPRTAEMYTTDGRMLWQTKLFEDMFTNPPYSGKPSGLHALATTHELIMAEDSGSIACIDYDTGVPKWTTVAPIDRLEFADVNSFGVLVAGEQFIRDNTRNSAQRLTVSVLQVLDRTTGKPLLSIQPDSENIISMAVLTDRGDLVYGYLNRLICIDMSTRQERWEIQDDDLLNSLWSGVIGSNLVAASSEGVFKRYRLVDGVSAPMPEIEPIQGGQIPPSLFECKGRTVLKTFNGVYILDGQARVIGMMAGTGMSDAAVQAVAVADGRIAILKISVMDPQSPVRTVTLDLIDATGRKLQDTLTLDKRVDLPKPNGMQAIDNWLVINTGRTVSFVAAPGEKSDQSPQPRGSQTGEVQIGP